MILAIDTATDACSVALLDGNDIVEEGHEIIGRGHAERLVPMIAGLTDCKDVQTIIVDCGPGSFTGLRVGLATARALGLGWSVEVYGYSSLALMAAMAFSDRDAPDRLAIAIAGGHGEMFVQRFNQEPFGELAPLVPLTPERAVAEIDETLIIGNAAAELVALTGAGKASDIHPRASEIRKLPQAYRNLTARPIYGRAPDARPPQ